MPTYLKIDNWVTPDLDFLSSSRKSNKKLKKKNCFSVDGLSLGQLLEGWKHGRENLGQNL